MGDNCVNKINLSEEDLSRKAMEVRKTICFIANKIDVIHIGGILSSVDILVALYYNFLNYKIDNLQDIYRDRLVLSKGHCAVLLYVIFCDLGIYKWDDVFLKYNQFGNIFGQHPNRKNNPGFEVSTGSLGHGLSIALGMALANRSRNIKSRIYCLVGDGEMQEGSNWEAIMYAGSHKLSNLVCIVDFNRCTSCFRFGDNIVLDWKKAFESFGWRVHSVEGSKISHIIYTLKKMPEVDFQEDNEPIAIILNTTKGQNIDFMKGPAWHYGSISDQLYDKAIESIERNKG